ncbi:MAG: hypothetical protein JO267_10525 [Alphaproteobacteria bacterium]|nr:hypothetical protein [Alphaproteobacteria bacterium]
MKALLIGALFAGAVTVAVTPVLSTVYADAYPQDPSKRQALAHCIDADRGFNRLIATERAACYGRYVPAQAPQAQGPRPQPHIAANFVDLWKSQARGHQPVNDVRLQQQNAEALRLIRSSIN